MLLAAVDLGSNSFRLEIGRVSDDAPGLIERHGYWKETLRLAAQLEQDMRLTVPAIRSACECLARMNERLRGLAASQVRAVGTQALRLARNAQEFLGAAEQALGYPIEIISGLEEARLVFEGCTHTLPPSAQRRLVVDVGGASTEFVIGQGASAQHTESFDVGCINTSVRFFKDGQITKDNFKRAQIAAGAQFEEAASVFSAAHWDEAYGASGTVGAVSKILQAQGWTNGIITAQALLKLQQQLISAGNIQRIELAGLTPDRQEVIAGGVAVLTAIFKTLGLHELHPARGALRIGVLHNLLGRKENRDIRDATVDRLLVRFGADRAQAQQVAQLAQAFFQALRPAHQAQRETDATAGRALDWAALVHELGLAISHHEPQRHGAYLIENADLAGFSMTEQSHLAALVLGQRGPLRLVHSLTNHPDGSDQLLALRLAVIFAHARRPVSLPNWRLANSRGSIDLSIEANWLAKHPLTDHLLAEEIEHWAKEGVRMRVHRL
ncbi:MAG TPA: Ppx/GppA phosphatase family protein [Burkholderiaceae bacterium]|nr:Ppx/GppA phosphatase family protein [Burkholderiaceae bacterium]